MLAEAAALGLTKRNECRSRGVAGCLQEALGHTRNTDGGAVLVPAGVQEAAAGHGGQVRACPGAARPGRAERRHRSMDDRGIGGGEVVIAEAQRCQVTHRGVLDECIGAPHQFEQP